MLHLIKGLFHDRQFLKNTLAIAAPVTFQSMLNMITNMVDTFMIGRLGEHAIAGVGLANKVFFVFILVVFGISSGMGILAAQYWGNHNVRRIRQVTGLSVVIALIVALIFCCSAHFAPVPVMGILTNSQALKTEGAAYLSVAALTYPLIAVTYILNSGMRSTGEVKAPVVISIIAIVTNIFFNYLLIFGHFGAPALGVRGAAIATVIARILEMLLTIGALRVRKTVLWCSFREFLGFDRALVTQFAQTALPVVINEFLWGLGTAMYSLAYGRMGETTAAAMTIVGTYMDIEVVGLKGLSAATAVTLGNELGAGNLEDAKRHSAYDLVLAFMVSLVLSALTFVIARPFTGFYDISAESARYVVQCLYVFALAMFMRAQNNIIIVGILRSGGDTIACALLDVLPVWLAAVPMVFISGLLWKLPVYIVFVFANIDEVIKFFIGFARYKKYVWLKNLNLRLCALEQRGGTRRGCARRAE